MAMTIKPVTSPEFAAYGRVLEGLCLEELLSRMEETPVGDDVVYVASVKELEDLSLCREMELGFWGGMPIQAGFCNGHNKKLNAVEYHRNSEINVAVTDMVLILGRQQDITPTYTYDTSKMEAFLIPAKTAVEIYGTTLHYAPCHVTDEGFRCVVILPKGTNTELEGKRDRNQKEDKLLFAKNKWLIGHEEGGLPEGAWIGLSGENLTI